MTWPTTYTSKSSDSSDITNSSDSSDKSDHNMCFLQTTFPPTFLLLKLNLKNSISDKTELQILPNSKTQIVTKLNDCEDT